MQKHIIKGVILFLSLFLVITTNTYAQESAFDLKKTSTQYTASGTVSVKYKGNGRYELSAVVKDLPSKLPNGGIYYILWATVADGRADNLGPITNSSEVKKELTSRVTQVFVTSEKERYPEFVDGPKIVQTDAIPAAVFAAMGSNTPAPSATATVRPSGSGTPRANASTPPIGGPAGAPETGLGGGALMNIVLTGILAFGLTGLTYSVGKKLYTIKK